MADEPADTDKDDDSDSETVDDRPRPSRRRVTLVISALVVLVALNYVGDGLTTTWADDHPLALIAFNSRNRVLLLTTNQLDALSFYGVATVRLMIGDPLGFLIGLWYGDAAVRWLERKAPTYGQLFRQIEKNFGPAAYPLVFIAPNTWICMFAGAAGMSLTVFLALNFSGTVVRLYLLRRLGETFEAPIDDVLEFFGRYQLPLLIISVTLVVLSIVVERRKGKGEIGAIRDLEDEYEGD